MDFPHDSLHDLFTTCLENPPLKNQWILALFKIRTSIPACIFKGFTTQKCKIPRFHRGVHGFTTLAPQGGVRGHPGRPRRRPCNRSASRCPKRPGSPVHSLTRCHRMTPQVRTAPARLHSTGPPTAASPPSAAVSSPPQPPLTALYCCSPQPARHLTAPIGSYRHLSAPK